MYSHTRHRISYRWVDGKWNVRQTIWSLSHYDLEGDFDTVIERLSRKKFEVYDKYVARPSILSAAYFVEPIPYPYKINDRVVQFNDIKLEWIEDDGLWSLNIIGVRPATEEEFDALEKCRLKFERESEQKERERYEKLKERFDSK